MHMDRFLNFILSHNATIIEVLFGLTLLVVTFLAIRMFLFAKDPQSASMDLGNLEATLKQILEKAGNVPAAGGGSEDGQRLAAEIANLKTELEVKKKQIDEISAAAGSAPAASGLSAEEKAALDSKIKELEAKLAEYEIISEDIADLSFYKEQNLKLKKEIETIKGGGGAGAVANPAALAPDPDPDPAPAPAPDPVPAKAEVKSEPAIVGKASAPEASPEPAPEPVVAAPVKAEPVVAPAAPASGPTPEADNFSVDDDLMAEFAAAVAKQKGGEAPDAASAAKPAEPAAQSAPPAASVPVEAAPAAAEDSGVDLGQVDIDKMMVEAQEIKSDVPEVDINAALGETVDESKLLKEAAAMNSVSAEDKQLMGEFENFVKKEN